MILEVSLPRYKYHGLNYQELPWLLVLSFPPPNRWTSLEVLTYNQSLLLLLHIRISWGAFENTQQFLKKLNIELLYDPAISLLALHPQKLKVRAQTATCTPMCIEAKWWKQPKCLSTDSWTKWGICIWCNIIQPWKYWNYSTCYNTDEPWKHLLRHNLVTKWQMSHDSTDMKHWDKVNPLT